MNIRKAQQQDLTPLLELYTQLHNNIMPEAGCKTDKLWDTILSDKNHNIIIIEESGKILSSCVLVIIPNLTQGQRPYALVENVITHKDHRNKGYATRVLNFAKDIAVKENCYKIMLLTGAKDEATLNFYEKSGYNKNDKTAFIQWL